MPHSPPNGTLSRDSLAGQRKGCALCIEAVDGAVDSAVECVGVSEGSMREMVRLEVVPGPLDVIQFRRILGQPLDGEPMRAGGERCQREFAGMDRSIVLDQDHWLDGLAGTRPVEPVELFEMGDEVAAALGRAGVHNELARDVIERSQHCDLLRLSRRRHTQIRPGLCPGTREVGMCQRLALVTVEQNDVAGFGLLFAQVQTQADPLDLVGDLAALQCVPRPPPAEFFCAAPWTIGNG